MKKFIKNLSIRSLIAILIVLGVVGFIGYRVFASHEGTHPFLLVTEDDYAALRAKSGTSPYSNIMSSASTRISTLSYDTEISGAGAKSNRMRDVVSAGALMYILDPDNGTTYKNKVRDTLLNWDDISPLLNCSSWDSTVPPGSAFFHSVLALDIIYNDLTSQEIEDIEAVMSPVADFYWNNSSCAWKENLYAAYGIYALYEGDTTRSDAAISNYINYIKNTELTTDGVMAVGPGYGWDRLVGHRATKSSFLDVIEFTGEDNTLYSDSQLISFHEWLYAGSLTPFRFPYTFGDTRAEFIPRTLNYPGTLRAGRFSTLAGDNASWASQESPTPVGWITNYLLFDDPANSPVAPVSRIWTGGMASFRENSSSTLSVAGALWNPTASEQHSHNDVNAVAIAAYGENILRNVGYSDFNNSCQGFSWEYIHDTAVSSNTVMINGVDHVAKEGAGIVEGFVGSTGLFDYASGDSGSALSNGTHTRNFVMVHPQDNKSAYFVLFDEVSTGNANIALHPASSASATLRPLEEYEWTLDQYTGENVGATIYLGTPPVTATIEEGALCTELTDYNSFVGEYLYSTYDAKPRIVTVVFPHDATHPKADFSRILGSGYSGAVIDFGTSVRDIAIEADSASTINYGNVQFSGLATLFRKVSERLGYYFVRKGSLFDDGEDNRQGFESDSDISIYMKDTEGDIISPDTDVTFYHENIVGVNINGSPATNIDSGDGWVIVNVPEGSHTLELSLDDTPTPTPSPTPTPQHSTGVGSGVNIGSGTNIR